MKRYWVYIHTCPNGKRYVGITTSKKPESRWCEGLGYKYNKHFYSAIVKYGWENITHEVFEVQSPEEMYWLEKYLIAYYLTTCPHLGYNSSTGGKVSSQGRKLSESHKQKNR